MQEAVPLEDPLGRVRAHEQTLELDEEGLWILRDRRVWRHAQPLRPLAAARDALGGDGVGIEPTRQTLRSGEPDFLALQRAKELRHGGGVVPGIGGQRLAHLIGLTLLIAPVRRDQPRTEGLAQLADGLTRIAAEQHGRTDGGRDGAHAGYHLARIALCRMASDHVTDLVAHDIGDLVLGVRNGEQAARDVDPAPGQREGIRLGHVGNGEVVLRRGWGHPLDQALFDVAHQPLADGVDVGDKLRIVHHSDLRRNLLRLLGAERAFALGGHEAQLALSRDRGGRAGGADRDEAEPDQCGLKAQSSHSGRITMSVRSVGPSRVPKAGYSRLRGARQARGKPGPNPQLSGSRFCHAAWPIRVEAEAAAAPDAGARVHPSDSPGRAQEVFELLYVGHAMGCGSARLAFGFRARDFRKIGLRDIELSQAPRGGGAAQQLFDTRPPPPRPCPGPTGPTCRRPGGAPVPLALPANDPDARASRSRCSKHPTAPWSTCS